ncbi:vitelline membrane outer layer protein 1-like [Mixophyes fleayi]|uniref:vitelline membrane outer layer protein 1-like n=1 Tax=Mixophyes fleayi TaxID=3061075 RepID=UPI003F4D987D
MTLGYRGLLYVALVPVPNLEAPRNLSYRNMSRVTLPIILLSLCIVALGEYAIISVPNGGPWGEWGPVEWCPCGYHAKGFSVKVESKQKVEDDTALNGIRLLCLNRSDIVRDGKAEYVAIQSSEGPWGEWSPNLWCPEGHLLSFSMQVEVPRKGADDTAANNLMFQCSDYNIFLGGGQSWGYYGRWSGICRLGICGMKTKVEPPQGSKDDTALNDVQFVCCKK